MIPQKGKGTPENWIVAWHIGWIILDEWTGDRTDFTGYLPKRGKIL
jgi:hypothetical protein